MKIEDIIKQKIDFIFPSGYKIEIIDINAQQTKLKCVEFYSNLDNKNFEMAAKNAKNYMKKFFSFYKNIVQYKIKIDKGKKKIICEFIAPRIIINIMIVGEFIIQTKERKILKIINNYFWKKNPDTKLDKEFKNITNETF